MLIVIGLNQRLGKDRRAAGDFIGASRVLQELKDGPKRRRVGLELIGGAPAREGAEILSADGQSTLGEFQRETGIPLILCCFWLILWHVTKGVVTSGIPSPTLSTNIAMGYIASGSHKKGTQVKVRVRKSLRDAVVKPMPFVPAKYFRASKA
jgi:aminomethyltransferase